MKQSGNLPVAVRQSKLRGYWNVVLVVAAAAVIIMLFRDKASVRPTVTLTVPRDGKAVVFSASGKGGSGIYRLDLASREVRCIIDTDDYESSPACSPDGTAVAYASYSARDERSRICLIDLANGQVTRLTDEPRVADSGAVFTTDGQALAFSRAHQLRRYSMGGWTWDRYEVATLDLRTRHVQELTAFGYRRVAVAGWSHDRRTVWYEAELPDAGSTGHVYALRTDGSEPPRDLTPGGRSYNPSLAPDGTEVVFISDREVPFSYGLWRMRLDTAQVERLPVPNLTRVETWSGPVFVPGSDSVLALKCPSPRRNELVRLSLDDSTQDVIAGPRLFEHPLSWRPTPP